MIDLRIREAKNGWILEDSNPAKAYSEKALIAKDSNEVAVILDALLAGQSGETKEVESILDGLTTEQAGESPSEPATPVVDPPPSEGHQTETEAEAKPEAEARKQEKKV